MLRFVITVLSAAMLFAIGAQAQQRSVQAEQIQLSAQMIEALVEGRVSHARALLDAARTDAGATEPRRQLTAGQVMEFMCTGHRCLCEGANDCVDLAGTGLCEEGTMRCDTRSCTCDRPQITR